MSYAIFTDQKAAQDLSDKIHQYLSDNCPGYSADRWQDEQISKAEKSSLWYVQLPDEFVKDFYPVKEKIAVACDALVKAAKEIDEKIPEDFKATTDIKP